MAYEIDWKNRYIDLENQLKEMMYMSLDLVEQAEITKTKAVINNIIYTEVDNQLEVTVIASANNPIFIFEIIDENSKKIVMQKAEIRKNSCKFNVFNISNYRVKVYIKNEGEIKYSDSKITKVLNRFINEEG